MEKMLCLLGSRDTLFLFVQVFLRQLTPSVRTDLANSSLVWKKDYHSLAKEADRIFLASRQYTMHGILPLVSQGEPGEGMAVAAVTAGMLRRKNEKDLCFYHRRFGTMAKHPTLFLSGTGKHQGRRLLTAVGIGDNEKLLFVQDTNSSL